jgi:hypothetical protein
VSASLLVDWLLLTANVFSGDLLPLSDRNAWYYPSLGHDSEEEDLGAGVPEGNWGHKNSKGARWVRRGKITPWGPEMDDWEVRESFSRVIWSYDGPTL